MNIEYHFNEIQIHLKWSSTKDIQQWSIDYLDDECTLPSTCPLYYLCSSAEKTSSSFNSTFYSYWFSLEQTLYQRLFSQFTNDNNQFILLLSLSDGRILVLPESSRDSSNPIIWYTSSSFSFILALNYDSNTNLLDAVLSSTSTRKFPQTICNHLIICESIGCLVIINSTNLRRLLIDNCLRSACIYSNQFIYLTRNEIRSIDLSHLFQIKNDDLINQSKIIRFGQFERLIVDGQEIILYYSNGTFQRLNNLLPTSTKPSHFPTLSNQIQKLTCLTTTINHLQSQISLLQRTFNKIEVFYQLNLSTCLKYQINQWKLYFTEQQLRIFQSNDFYLILICQLSNENLQIYQLNSSSNWTFQFPCLPCLCQPILVLRCQNENFCKLGQKQLLLPFYEQIQLTNEIDFNHQKFKIIKLHQQQYHLVLTIRNQSAEQFKKMNMNLTRKIQQVHIDCKQQEIKVDTDAGLVDALTIQITLSTSCLKQLIFTFSNLIQLFYTSKTNEEKNFIKQTDVVKLIDLIQESQTKCRIYSDELLLNLLQIRIYLSMFRLGSNYTVQFY